MAQNVAIPDELHAAIKKEAGESGMKITAIVERAIRQWLKGLGKKK